MQKAVPVGVGAMAALLGLDFDVGFAVAAEAAQGEVCQAANDNGAGQVVVSGDKAAVERAVEIAKAKGAKRAMLLPVSAPFHCALMQPAADGDGGGAGQRRRFTACGAAGRQCAGQADHAIPPRLRARWSRRSPARCAGANRSLSWRRRREAFYEVGAGKVLQRPHQAYRRGRSRNRDRHARGRRGI